MAQRNGTYTNGVNGTHIPLPAATPSAGAQPAMAAASSSVRRTAPATNGHPPPLPDSNGTSIPSAAPLSATSPQPSAGTQSGVASSSSSPPENAPLAPPVISPASPATDPVDSITTGLDALLRGPAPPPSGDTPANRQEAMRAMAITWQRLTFAGLDAAARVIQGLGEMLFGADEFGRASADVVANA